MEQPVHLNASDGRVLGATWFEPPAQAHAVAVVSAAGGVPQRHYRAFAAWLATQGFAVLTYDYRGTGASRAGPVRQDPASLHSWAVLDMGAALAAARARAVAARPALPLLLVGHSFGGNSAAFAPGVQAVDALLMVAAGAAQAQWARWPQRALLHVIHRAWLPALLRLHGHLPGWALGPGGQALPAGVARQWLRWARSTGGAFDDAQMRGTCAAGRITAPVHLWSFADDRLHAPERAVDALASRFTAAGVQRHHRHPAELGLRRLGHFGAFSRHAGPAFWQHLLQPLQAAVPALRPPQAPVYSAPP